MGQLAARLIYLAIFVTLCSIMAAVISIYSDLLIFPQCMWHIAETYPREVERHFPFPLIDYIQREEDPG